MLPETRTHFGIAEPCVARLRALIETMLQEAKVPGCSIALVNAGGLIWSDAFGFADPYRRRPARPDTIYHLFSGTKLFTAAAVLQLVERGALRLDDKASRFIPDAAVLADISLLHLLSHQSGLNDTLNAFLGVSFSAADQTTSAEALRHYRLVAKRRPGERVEYRNVNYAILGDIITRVSGLEYRDYVARNILVPLGMGAGFAVTEEMRPRTAIGHIGRFDPMRLVLRVLLPEVARRLYGQRVDGLVQLHDYNLSTAAIGGLVGSVLDFSRFLEAQLGDGGGILNPQSLRSMQTLVAPGPAGIESRVGVGLGWKFGQVGTRVFLNHEGGGAGFTSELRLYPEAGIGIALAMNAMRMPKTMRLAHRMCEAVFSAGVGEG